MAKVSVIIPVYNAEVYLRDTLNSVLSQSFSDVEVVCVNDGSTDGSAEILGQFETQDKRVKIVSQSNGGGSAARNKGIEQSTGEYLMFIDADDMYAENIIADAHDRAVQTGVDIVFYNFSRFVGRPTRMATINRITPSGELQVFTKETYADRFFNDFAIITWNKLIKRSVVVDNGLRFDTALSHNHDVDFSIRLMLAANSYSWLDKVGYYYRDSESGLTATKRSDPTNVLKILINNNKQIAADYKLLKPSYNNYVADMIAGTIFKYQKDSKKVRQIFDFSHDVVMPEVGLDGDGVLEPTGVFEVVRQGDYSKLVSLINNPKRKIKTIAKRSYSAIQGIVARFTL